LYSPIKSPLPRILKGCCVSPRHEALRAFLVEKRKKAGLTQAQAAARLRRYQSFVANLESGERRIDAVELVELAEAIGFKPGDAIKRIVSAKRN
jgi:transcriptional regulator with XRE-family HTH domain